MLFEMYQDPKVIAYLIGLFSILTNFIIWFFAAYLFKLAYYFKKNKTISNNYILLFSFIITFINWLGVDINLYFITPAYLYVTYCSYKWIPQKSLKWINLSTALFILFIILTYAFFNYKIHYITYVFFSSNDILEYSFKFKPYFLIYHVGDFLGSVNFVISNKPVQYVNEPLQYRIYLFYYSLNFIGLATWLWIYVDVLKKHKFNYNKIFKVTTVTTTNIVNIEKSKVLSDSHNMEDKVENKVENIIEENIQEKILTVTPIPNFMETKMTTTILDNLETTYNEQQNKNYALKEKILLIKEKQIDLKIAKHTLATHTIFQSLNTIEDLKLFMEQHIYCVWDFMSLLKKLQKEICSTSIPWMPIKNGFAARLINEIVLGEESDELPDGNYASHFSIYLQAMKEIGANTTHIDLFIQQLEDGKALNECLTLIPQPAQDFVRYTIGVATEQSLYANLGSFFHGRENVIPNMFSSLLKDWSITKEQAPMFHYYLVRHIELDGDEHGPAGDKLIDSLIENNPDRLLDLLNCSLLSVQARIKLWDELAILLKNNKKTISIS